MRIAIFILNNNHTTIQYQAENPFYDWIFGLIFFNNGRRILWDVSTGEKLKNPDEYADRVANHAFNVDGKLLTTAMFGGSIKIWDYGSGTLLKTFKGHQSYIQSIAFSPDRTKLATANKDGTMYLWDLTSLTNAAADPK